jgi:hypothetical protein
MFYLLLVIPHVVALGGLFAFAFYADRGNPGEGGGASDGNDGGLELPRSPKPGPGGGDLPLPDADQPRRRLHVGEQLADLHPRPARRERDPAPPRRAPTRD